MSSSFTIRRAEPSSTTPAQQEQPNLNTTLFQRQQSTINSTYTSGKNDIQELTRTSKYKISKLSKYDTPQSLVQCLSGSYDEEKADSTADINTTVKYAIHSTASDIFVWKYATDEATQNANSSLEKQNQLVVQIPVTNNAGFSPLTKLIPSKYNHSETYQEIGLLITNTHTGKLTYYRSINHIQASSLLKSHYPQLYELRLYDGEFITIVEDVSKFSGIVLLSTSFGRLLLVCLNINEDGIKVREIEGKKTGFFSKYLHPSHEIVSIRSIDSSDISYNEALISTFTKGGKFTSYAISNDGQYMKREELPEIGEVLACHVEGLYPEVRKSLQVLDFSSLPNHNKNCLLLLAAFKDSNSPEENDDWCYVLFTLKRSYQDLLIDSAYRMNTYNLAPSPLVEMTRLHVPSPGLTAFVLFENHVVLVELNDVSSTSTVNMRTTKKKWEDIISFKDSLSILSSDIVSVTSSQTENNPTVMLVLSGVGIIQIERLPQQDDKSTTTTTTAGIIKSHIEQAVFFSSSSSNINPIQFSFPSTISLNNETHQEIETELLAVAGEILNSCSAYLPPTLSDLLQHLQMRKERMERLLKYAAHNFQGILSENIKLELVSYYEKICSAGEVYQTLTQVKNDNSISIHYKQTVSELGFEGDDLFLKGLEKFQEFLLSLTTKLTSSDSDLSVKLLIASYSPILSVSTQIRSQFFNLDDTHIPKILPWYLVDGSYEVIDDAYQSYYGSKKMQSSTNSEFKQDIIELTNVLFYLLQQRIIWLNHQIEEISYKRGELEELLVKDEAYYLTKSTIWIQTLYSLGYHEESIAIAENYKDMKSLVLILDDANEDKLDHYFLEFGYTFAEALYTHYISTNQLTKLFQTFWSHSSSSSATLNGSYLNRFLHENHDQYKDIAWIQELLLGEELTASRTLLNASHGTEKREVLLSISKLAAFASLEQEDEEQSGNVEALEMLSSVQEKLDLVEIEGLLMSQIQPYFTSSDRFNVDADSLKSDLLEASYQNKVLFKTLQKSFSRSLTRLLQGDSLSLNEMVELLTLMKTQESTKLNFLHSLRVIHLSNSVNFTTRQFAERITWMRALYAYIQSESSEVQELQNKSDEYKRQYIKETALFQTIKGYFDLELYKDDSNGYSINLPSLNSILQTFANHNDIAEYYPYLNSEELKTIQNELVYQIESFSAVQSLENSILGMIGEIVEELNDAVVVNYEDLSVGY